MAKATTPFEKFQQGMPSKRQFRLTMQADSTTECGVEIDTDIDSGEERGWIIVGFEWQFVDIASPFTKRNLVGTGTASNMTLQLCRGDLPSTLTLLHPSDKALIMEDIVSWDVLTAVGAAPSIWPRKKLDDATTQYGKLHVRFGTTVDDTNISAATIEIYGNILYYPVVAPAVPSEAL